MIQQELVYKVKESIRKLDPRARVILFGSRARGDSKPNSDWDFLIISSLMVNEKIKRQIRNGLIDTELDAEEVISTLIYSQDDWDNYQLTPLYRNIAKEGVEI
jgi:predicted nucleotidyltransferase